MAHSVWGQSQVAGAAERVGSGLQAVVLKRAVEGAGSREAGTCIGSWVP